MVEVEIINEKALIITPYNKDFIARIKQIGGARWDPGKRAWAIPISSLPEAREILLDVYGEDDISPPAQKHDVEVTVLKRMEAICGPVQLMGRTLARAYHRDSGARPGDGVSLIEGTIRSDGSLAKWKSVVEEGAVFKLYDVPENMIEKERGNADCVRIAIIK